VTFSPNLEANICEAARLASFFNCKLILIHVGEQSTDKENTFKSFLVPFIDDDLDFELVFQSGDPVDVILNVTKKKGRLIDSWSIKTRELF
jgi:hypothetical protein